MGLPASAPHHSRPASALCHSKLQSGGGEGHREDGQHMPLNSCLSAAPLSIISLAVVNSQFRQGTSRVEYRGRTELLKDGMADGRVALKIRNITFSDAGWYRKSFGLPGTWGSATGRLVTKSFSNHCSSHPPSCGVLLLGPSLSLQNQAFSPAEFRGHVEVVT
uniref:Uncharacterized protein n=1 Tax=Chelydra serpentina TaxID=8475 RepID=A0A8C3T0D4_CHESE